MNMYRENFIICIKSNGRILREKNNSINLPFGSEYSILLKNLDSRKAVVGIDIDGEDIIGSRKIIVDPNDSVELKGKKINKKVRNRFKFIKKTDQIVKHRGDRIDDGIIRVEVTFEAVEQEDRVDWQNLLINSYKPNYTESPHIDPLTPWFNTMTYASGGIVPDSSIKYCLLKSGESVIPTKNVGGFANKCSNNINNNINNNIKEDEGITVKGSEINQNFHTGYTKTLESQSTVFTIKLKGTTDIGIKVMEPVFTKDKIRCSTCGRKSKSSVNYCSYCGTKL